MIRPTFLAFETAKRALNVSQAGLDTVGHNISNANTPGYTRQRVDQVSLSMNGIAQKYQTFGASYSGLGADIKSISQVRDPYLDNRYRAEAAVNGELGVKNYGLTDINNIFDETTTDGLSAKLSELLDALDKLSTQADSKEFANVVKTTASQLVQLLNENAQALEKARTEQKLDLTTTVSDNVNTILERIASLNTAIKQDNFYGNPSNDLNDTRNLLIDQLSEYMDIKVVRTPVEVSKGLFVENVSIYLNDGSDPPIALVESGHFNTLEVSEDESNGNVIFKLIDGISGLPNPTVGNNGDITSNIYKGALKGYIDIINGAGPGADSGVSTFRGIPYYQASLDEFAQTLASVFNSVNNITAGDIDDNNAHIYKETFEKNLFTALTPTITQAEPLTDANWIKAFNTGTLGFSGNTPYNISFTTNATPTDDPTKVFAEVEVNGQKRTYAAEYSATGGEMKFYEVDSTGETIGNTVAFSITGDGTVPGNLNIELDAKVTAKNITISKNWMDNPLYMTASKLDPSTVTATVLSISGTSPSWLKSVSNGSSGVLVQDGSYQFDKVSKTVDGVTSDYLRVKIGDTFYDSDKPLSQMKKGEQIALKNGDTTGLYVTLSSTFVNTTDYFSSGSSTVNIKNETAAANDNILKFKEAMFADNFYSKSGFTGSFHEFIVSFQSEMALDMSINTSLLDTSTTVMSSYADRRDAVSAVSVDEEAINMMTYQNYYNAAARYMNVIDEALDKIINGMGMVGR